MPQNRRAYAQKPYEEWRDESWQGAEIAIEKAIQLLKDNPKLRRIKIGKPFDIEVEAFEPTKSSK